MMTFGSPLNLQVEMKVRKIAEVNSTAVLLFSGSVADSEAIVNKTREKVKDKTLTTEEVALIAAENYQIVKTKRVEDTILRPMLGVGYSGFGPLIAQGGASQLLQNVMGMIMQHNLGLELLVGGFDVDGAHLFTVSNPGVLAPFDGVGFAATGSGGLHASIRLSLGGQGRDLPLVETLHNVYEAKAAAEVAPGVGKLTDIAILNARGLRFLDEAAYGKLATIRRKRPALPKSHVAILTEICGEAS